MAASSSTQYKPFSGYASRLAASINPYLTRSAHHEAPLFHSTAEGYPSAPHHGAEADDNDILPAEADLFRSSEHAGGDDYSLSSQQYDIPGDGYESDKDPFQISDRSSSVGPSDLNQNAKHYLAAQALSAMMASELAMAADPFPQRHTASPPTDGWKVYETQKLPPKHPQNSQFESITVLGTEDLPPDASIAIPHVTLPQMSYSTTGPPRHPLLRGPPPPEVGPSNFGRKTPGALPGIEEEFVDEDELENPFGEPQTLYIYPSEARDPQTAEVGSQLHRDPAWLVLWLLSIAFALWQVLWLALWAHNDEGRGGDKERSSTPHLLQTLPVVTILTMTSLAFGCAAAAFLIMVQKGIGWMVRGILAAVPIVLALTGIWTWAASFSASSDSTALLDPSTLRWIGVICIAVSYLIARGVWARRKRIERTVKVLELCGTVVVSHKPLVLVCLVLSLAFTVTTLPFLSLIYRLLLVGHRNSGSWVIDSSAVRRAIGVSFAWVWTLGVLRGIQRHAVSGVVASWYFNRHSPDHPGPLTLTSQALIRATGPSLGTLCEAAFLSAVFDGIAWLLQQLRKWTKRAATYRDLPIWLVPLAWISPIAAVLAGLVEVVNGYAIVWSGVTGDDFGKSSTRIASLLRRNGTIGLADNLLVKLLLNLTSFTLSLVAGLIGVYATSFIVTDPEFSPFIAMCCTIVPFWTIRFSADIVANAADTLFCCWNIDLDTNVNHCAKAQEAFGEPIRRSQI